MPVYNTEQYLEQCLASVINQTLHEIEIICVDDGSTDRSVEILKEYQEKDPRIQILYQKNSYAGVARNTGKAVAKGEYLVFWDSDDYFFPAALEKMYNQCKKDDADVCLCGGKQYLETEQKEIRYDNYLIKSRIPKEIPFNIRTAPEHILDMENMAPWNKMFRRAHIEKHQIDFKPVRNGNDVFFVTHAICLAEAITIVNEPLVCYRVNRPGALTSTRSADIEGPIATWVEAAESLKSLGAFPEQSFANRALASMLYTLKTIATSWPSFQAAFYRLQSGALEQMGITEREPGYYYSSWQEKCLQYLLHNTAEEFLMQYLLITDNRLTMALGREAAVKTELQTVKAEKKRLQTENNKLKQKISYRIWRMITWLPRKIRAKMIMK